MPYNRQKDGNIIKYDIKYYENNELIWNEKICERDYSLEEMAKILNDNNFAIELFSQHFFDEKRIEKWKCIARKIE